MMSQGRWKWRICIIVCESFSWCYKLFWKDVDKGDRGKEDCVVIEVMFMVLLWLVAWRWMEFNGVVLWSGLWKIHVAERWGLEVEKVFFYVLKFWCPFKKLTWWGNIIQWRNCVWGEDGRVDIFVWSNFFYFSSN